MRLCQNCCHEEATLLESILGIVSWEKLSGDELFDDDRSLNAFAAYLAYALQLQSRIPGMKHLRFEFLYQKFSWCGYRRQVAQQLSSHKIGFRNFRSTVPGFAVRARIMVHCALK